MVIVKIISGKFLYSVNYGTAIPKLYQEWLNPVKTKNKLNRCINQCQYNEKAWKKGKKLDISLSSGIKTLEILRKSL